MLDASQECPFVCGAIHSKSIRVTKVTRPQYHVDLKIGNDWVEMEYPKNTKLSDQDSLILFMCNYSKIKE